MATVYTVAQINQYIKNMFANDYLLRNVKVQGEISNLKYHSSGHIYFTIKDEESAMAGVMFKTARYSGLDFELQNGQSVCIEGNVAVYERDGRYQIYAKQITQAGIGHLHERYEMLKQKLYEEGLFEFECKKEIPQYPKKIGIVTAKTGAAIQDICNVAKRRNPYVQLYLYPAKVQGDGAAETIVAGIQYLDQMGLDTIIIGRGGGSIEDLWAFNEEIVARAIFDSKTPIISGTGHEIDNTIADYVADLRAPTPSAACEMAIPDVMSYVNAISAYWTTMNKQMNYRLQKAYQTLDVYRNKLFVVSPENKLNNQKIYTDALEERMINAMKNRFVQVQHRYDMLLTRLNGLSPTAKLTGGYGYLSNQDNDPVLSVDDIHENDTFSVTIWNGSIEGKVTKIDKNSEK